MVPQTRYAKSRELNIAYQVVGDGPFDLVYVPGWVSNIEMVWTEPNYARVLGRLASFSRLILFDKRGTGLSDRVSNDRLPTLEQRMDDVRAVMDAAGSDRAALFGHSEGGSMSILFAATYPQRSIALALYGSFAKRLRSDDYPWAPTLEERLSLADEIERGWGDVSLEYYVPSRATDEPLRQWLSAYFRGGASPAAAAALLRMNSYNDVRAVLSAVRVPTLVLHASGDRDVKVDEGRYVAAHIEGARFLEVAGGDHIWFLSPKADEIVDALEEFLTGTRPVAELRPFSRHRPFHRHRRRDRESRGARRPRVARAFGTALRSDTRAAAQVPRHGGRYRRRRLLRDLRRSGTCGACRDQLARRGPLSWPRDPRGRAHGRVRADRGEGGRDRRHDRRPRARAGECRRGARLEHGAGSHRGIRPAVRGPRPPRAQRRSRRMAALCRFLTIGFACGVHFP